MLYHSGPLTRRRLADFIAGHAGCPQEEFTLAEPSQRVEATQDWSARQYLKFEDERTRPPRDLLAQVPLTSARRVADLGCGPGNSTELLVERFAGAEVIGVDSSPDMLRQARERLPSCTFVEGDLADWTPEQGTELLFGNAVFHWVPDHPKVLARLLQSLPPAGVLAVQMPDNTGEPALMLMDKVAASGPWAAAIVKAGGMRYDLPRPGDYYDLLRPLCRHFDIWHTHYIHVIAGPAGVVEWFKGSSLRPFLAPLDGAMREAFTARYTEEIRVAYPARSDGKVLLRFPRLFIVAVR
jgi:trans-aconitate 2-methyltransferase